MRETWYILEDGSNADPRDVAPDAKGILRHKSGMAVAIGSHGNHRSRGVDLDEQKKHAAKKPTAKDRQITAGKEAGGEYKTR